MLHRLPHYLSGTITLLVVCINTFFWCCLLYPLVFLKLVLPFAAVRHQISRFLVLIAKTWIEGNSLAFKLLHRTKWDIQCDEGLTAKNSYLVISNHRSWADIFVLQHVLKRKTPFLKFFIKQELIWVPLLGLAWWALDFPFLKRYSQAFLEKHPEFRGKDIEATRKHCERFKTMPVSVMNFLEGTRFTHKKQQRQKASYHHLLQPKAGGVAIVLSSMGDYLSKVLDVTIVYPENNQAMSFWKLLAGNIPKIVVRVKTLPIPEQVVGADYSQDPVFRNRVQQWVNTIWQDKDRCIDQLLSEYEPVASQT